MDIDLACLFWPRSVSFESLVLFFSERMLFLYLTFDSNVQFIEKNIIIIFGLLRFTLYCFRELELLCPLDWLGSALLSIGALLEQTTD